MSDEIYRRAMDKAAALRKQADELEVWAQRGLELGVIEATDAAPAAMEAPVRREKTGAATPTPIVVSESVAVLKSHGRPMPAAEIFDLVVRRGVKIRGQTPKANLTAKFASRKDLLSFNKDDGKWYLVEWLQNKAPTDKSVGASRLTEGDTTPSNESRSRSLDDLIG